MAGYQNEPIRFDLSELDELTQKVPGAVSRALELLAQELNRQMKLEAPVDDGYMRSSIEIPRRTGEFEYSIFIGADYWRPVQFGSKPHVIEAVNAQTLHFYVDGNEVFCKRVNHPGTAANPFIDRALDNVEPRIDEFVDIALEEISPR